LAKLLEVLRDYDYALCKSMLYLLTYLYRKHPQVLYEALLYSK